jgi:hypothetical protein
MRQYAFIDAHNTQSSAKDLGFKIQPQRLIEYLKNHKWSCNKVFWYAGNIRRNTLEKNSKGCLENIGYVVQNKETKFYKHKDTGRRILKANCDKEGSDIFLWSSIIYANVFVSETKKPPRSATVSNDETILLHLIYKSQVYLWCPRQESNPQQSLRTGVLYPFNYKGTDY